MTIEQRVVLVEELFQNLDIEIKEFQSHTKLSCVAGCGKCCNHPEIDASPLEFLPWAFHLFLNGEAEKVLNTLNKSTINRCFIYNPLSLLDKNKGNCSSYQYRGLICRLFGFGANTDKYGQLRLATCKIIKEGQAENYNKSTELITSSNLLDNLKNGKIIQNSFIDTDLEEEGNGIEKIGRIKDAFLHGLSIAQYFP